MLRYRGILIIAIVIVGLALSGWFVTPQAKDIVSYVTDVILILSALIAFAVFYDWQRSNVNTRWWIWDITFWNKQGVALSNFKLPAIIIHLAIVNPNIFTIVVDKINLTISERKSRVSEYVLTASAFSDEKSFAPHERVSGGVPLLEPKSEFYPIIIKPLSEKICWVVFVSLIDEPKKLENMLNEGKYEGKLELMAVIGTPISVNFGFNIDRPHRKEYEAGNCRIDYLSIKEQFKHENSHAMPK